MSALKMNNVAYKYLLEIKEYLPSIKIPQKRILWPKGLMQTVSGVLELTNDILSNTFETGSEF